MKRLFLAPDGRLRAFIVMLLLLAGVLLLLMPDSFLPGQILFSNDGPLGRLVSQCHRMPDAFNGVWQDLNLIGFREGGAMPNITSGLRLLLGPVAFSKFYVPLALLLLGLGAFCFFQQLRLSRLACFLGGLAAMLNSCFFSTACWGLGSLAITVAMMFFALAGLADLSSPLRWVRVMLAGFAVGMGILEGSDIGAIFSVFVAAFGLYQAAIQTGPSLNNLAYGVARVGLVALFAAFLAAQALVVLVQTQVEAVSGMRQDVQAKANHWDWATKWSLPKREALGVFVPGLFGFRMDSNDGGAYWGAAGRDLEWDKYLASGKQGPPPDGFIRYSGGGAYAGDLVVLIALWAVFQSFRRKNSAFAPPHRRWLWFWLALTSASLLFAFGRYAPFYRLLYALPYFSTIRNPAKFLHVFSFGLVVIFAYGVDGLARLCLRPARAGEARPPGSLKLWWSRAGQFERSWTYAMLAAVGLSMVGWWIYSSWGEHLQAYLETVNFQPEMAQLIAAFSLRQVGWFIAFLVASVGLLILLLSGRMGGTRARTGGILLGCLLVLDLGRANLPWIKYWNVRDKYASNPVVDLLRANPHAGRVSLFPSHMPAEFTAMQQVYRIEWLQHLFPYYNVESLDISQMPRTPRDITAFEAAMRVAPSGTDAYKLGRRWELTNTRYLISPLAVLDTMNGRLDPVQKRFQVVTRFQLVPKPGVDVPRTEQDVTATLSSDGPFALIEFKGALPRVSLYTQWQLSTNDQQTLTRLADPSFNLHQTVLVSGGVPAASAPAQGVSQNGSVQALSYAPKDLVFNAQAVAPSVLLLNDRFDPSWNVFVDGRPQQVLRCNYFMRGVFLPPGTHKVEFRFQPPIGPLYVSLAAIALALVFTGVVISHSLSCPEAAGKTAAAPEETDPVAGPAEAEPVGASSLAGAKGKPLSKKAARKLKRAGKA